MIQLSQLANVRKKLNKSIIISLEFKERNILILNNVL